MGWQLKSRADRVQFPAQQPLARVPARLTLKHLFDRGRLLPRRWVGGGQRAKDAVNGRQGGPHHSTTLWRRLGQQQKVVDIDINGGDGWAAGGTHALVRTWSLV